MADDDPIIEITKLEAARRQLRAAIRLWFDSGDPISIHTLAAATYEILHTLFRRRGLRGLIFDFDLVKDEHRQDWVKGIKAMAGFFKHADRDPDGVFKFNPFANEMLLFFSVQALEKMGEPLGVEESALIQWIFISRPNFLIPQVSKTRQFTFLSTAEAEGRANFSKDLPGDTMPTRSATELLAGAPAASNSMDATERALALAPCSVKCIIPQRMCEHIKNTLDARD